ncbi:RsmB/NOP family class I SAM-dependent RNA methyltransferase [Granulibacter bethesdensis]|uniref:RsmB/NOP family class I SAM-dependent RNA methyltransferase n=1 Tax=Granulibacter bethesdensis TaxID=364410 RepID=UPI0003F20353|nr:RsmB/NOP family class I SAM-dependent RNA methyltransferase [Granulibacter bethesdensis]AHJ69059.1 16S rRNA m(5)C 967 methyltransferase [Granulibacter bethesdensis]
MTPSARLAAAITLLEEIEAAPRRPADAVANDFFRARRYIGGSDRRAVSAHAWQVLRARRRMGWWLPEAPPRLLVAGHMLLTGWTLEAVTKAFSGGQYAPARLTETEHTALRLLEGHTLDHPEMPDAVRLELPDWILPRFVDRFGPALAAELAEMESEAPLDLRVNLLKSDRDTARSALRAEGIEAEFTTLSPWGLRVHGRRPVTTGAAFRQGLIEIQDEGSQLIAALVGAGPDMRVVDYCAGAGGKTLAMAMTMLNRGHIVACDTSEPRLEGAVRRLRRAGVHNVERHLLTAGDKWVKRRAGSFDRVLVDAPCTGTGTWRRNPDGRLRLTETDLLELVPKQADILDRAATLLRPGGRLVYATCSVLAEENTRQIEAFLARRPEFRLMPLRQAWPDAPAALTGDMLSLTPRSFGTDGFFAAVLEKPVPA